MKQCNPLSARRHNIKGLMLAFALMLAPFFAGASHGVAPVSDIDYTGMGTFTGSYTQSTTDHVWVVFNANAGDVINISLSTAFQHYYWLYRSNVGCIQVGNSSSNTCMTLVSSNGGSVTNGTYSYTVGTTGQFAFQLDSYIGQSGSYSITLSGSSATTVLCTTTGLPCGSANSLTTDPIAGAPFCAGSPVAVSYTASGTFNSGNTFTAELSNASGSFASPVSIGYVTSTANGTINATIPSSTTTGGGYRIRVVSSNPVVMGTDNGSNVAIGAAVNQPSNQAVCHSSATVAVNFTGAATTYSWTNTNTSIGLAASGTGNIPSFTATNTGTMPVTANITVTPTITGPSGTQTFTTPGTTTFTVPTGVTSLNVTMYGAEGGAGGQGSNTALGGKGGLVTATLAVTPGQQLQVNVGGAGVSPSGNSYDAGGFNGGGYSLSANSGATRGSGGGASDIRTGSYGLSDRVLVAGGGGGGAGVGTGGDGGALTGGNGVPNSTTWGSGGTQSGGGTQTTTSTINPLASGTSGNGGSGGFSGSASFYQCGGGGGYYGGAAGIGAGGGSSFIGGTGVSAASTSTSSHSGDGNVAITWGTSCSGTPQTFTITVSPTLTATSSMTQPYPLAGQELQTVYLNYPGSAQTQTINVAPTGGNGSYAYTWQKSTCNGSAAGITISGATSSSYTWMPAYADTCTFNGDNVYIFKATITSGGCTTTTSKKLNVVNPYIGDAATSNVQICHKVAVRGGTTTQILQVAPSTVQTHLSHGDYLGNCAVFNGIRSVAPETESQLLAVYPNPSNGIFILELSYVTDEATILITDVQGKLVARTNLAKDVAPTATFDFTGLAKGMYLIQVRDGELNYRTKIVIQ